MRHRPLFAPADAASSAASAPVFLDYTQEQLDRAYDQSVWAPDMASLEVADGVKSAEVRRRMPPRTERFGTNDTDLIDIFTPPDARNVPVLLFLHGGAWTRNTRQDASFPAPTLVGRGAAYLTPDFGSLKSLRLPEMIENCRRALDWTVHNAARFGGDPDRVFLAGHSAGAHLASCVLITNWIERGLPANAIKGALLLSGMYDLYPVRLSSRRKFLHITPDEEAAASAMRHLDRIACPVAIASADRDSPEFKRQSTVLADALQGMGKLASRTVAIDANHFQENERLAEPDSEICRALFALMKI